MTNWTYKMVDLDLTESCNLKCSYCVPEGSRVLMSSLSWRPIEKIYPGDEIIGFDETRNKVSRRKLELATVTELHSRKSDTITFYTEGGNLTVTPDHLLLEGPGRWRRADKFIPGQYLKFVSFPVNWCGETRDYIKGYLVGAFEGDGSLGRYEFSSPKKKKYTSHVVRWALQDRDFAARIERYSKILGLNFYKSHTTTSRLARGKNYKSHVVQSRKKSVVDKFEKFIKSFTNKIDTTGDFKSGYLAGIFDSEGSCSQCIRIHNTNSRLLNKVKSYLTHFNFNSKKENYKKSTCNSIRILGGTHEMIRFHALVNPAIFRKKSFLLGKTLKNNKSYSKILRIHRDPDKIKVFDISTTTSTFIVEGFAVHNCYKKDLMGSRISLPVAKRTLDLMFSAPGKGERKLNFFGGEPLAEWNRLKEVVIYGCAKSRETGHDFRWGVTTNCTLLKEDMIPFFKVTKGGVHVSIDGIPEIQDKNRPHKNPKLASSELLRNNVLSALKITPLDTARCTVTPESSKVLFHSILYIFSLGFQKVAPIPVFELDWTESDWNTLDTEYSKLTDWFILNVKKGVYPYIKFLNDGIMSLISSKPRKHFCGAGRTLVGVDLKGRISPCHRFVGVSKNDWGIGNVSDSSWDWSKLNSFRIDISSLKEAGICKKCIGNSVCSYGCPAVSWETSGDITRIHENECKAARLHMKHAYIAKTKLTSTELLRLKNPHETVKFVHAPLRSVGA